MNGVFAEALLLSLVKRCSFSIEKWYPCYIYCPWNEANEQYIFKENIVHLMSVPGGKQLVLFSRES